MDIVGHGGGCCGMRHIMNMDHSTVADLDRLIAGLSQEGHNAAARGAGRLIEIVLSSRQVGDRRSGNVGARWSPCVDAAGGWPNVLRERGFRLVTAFENANSSNACYVFHWHPFFKSLAPADLPFEWDHTFHPDAGGAGVNRAAPVRAHGLAIGDHATYRNPGNPNHGLTARIDRISQGGNHVEGIWTATGAPFRAYSIRNFTRTRAAPPAPAPDPRRVVATISTFHGFYRRDGRRGAGYDTAEAARAANPRIFRVDRKDTAVRADGTTSVNWVEGV